MDILKQLNMAVEYIEKNLCDEPDIDEAARLACVTKDSFMRFFSYITGMTVTEYIRRRRLTLAAYDLQRTNQSVIDIAVKYGWSGADPFARAFLKQHGIKPSDARDISAPLKVCPPVSFHITVKGGKNMNFKIIAMPETKVWGITRDFGGKAGERFGLEQEMWAEDCEHIPEKICSGYDGKWYGVWNNGKYAIARDHADVTGKGLQEITIPAGTYAAFKTDKSVYAGEALPQLRELIFGSWLADSGYRQTVDIEVEIYHLWTNHAERREKRYFEILIPVEPVKRQ